MTTGPILKLATVAIAVVVVLILFPSLFEQMDANEIMVIQSPVRGKLTWHTTPGVKYQGFGKAMHYHKRSQYWFSSAADQGGQADQSIKIRFNDGGHAQMSGSIAWEMPTDEKHLNEIHAKYGTQQAIEQQLIRTVVEKSVYMTGPLMSSKESYAERRTELLRYIEDQVQNGVYETESEEVEVDDHLMGTRRKITKVKIVVENGKEVRTSVSPLSEFGVRTFNAAINSLPYDQVVEAQIQSQQQAIMQVQTAIAEAKKAEQAAITAESHGKAEAAKAKWEQEVIKAKEVTAAEQRRDIAKLDAEAAALKKQEQILLGEGEAERKRLVMAADGALEKKLEAYVKVNELYAAAIERHPGPWVPSVVMGGSAGANGGNAALPLIDLLTAKAAKDLGLDLGMKSK